MVGVVVRVGKADADTDKTERHDGDGDQTFHTMCSIVPMYRASALARSLLEETKARPGRLSRRRARLGSRLGTRGRKLGVRGERRQPCRACGNKTWSQRLRRHNARHEQRRTCGALEDTAIGGALVVGVAARAVVARCTHRHLRLCGVSRDGRRRRHQNDDEAQGEQCSEDGANNPHCCNASAGGSVQSIHGSVRF